MEWNVDYHPSKPGRTEFVYRVKYPRTYHVPWSLGATSDDKVLAKAPWTGKVVITEKMDGECTTLYRDGTHARSRGESEV